MFAFRRHRVPLVVLSACLVLAALFAEAAALAVISRGLDHDCCGDDCPVCLQMEAAQHVLRTCGLPGLAAAAAGAALWAEALARKIRPGDGRRLTLVALKIKLSC